MVHDGAGHRAGWVRCLMRSRPQGSPALLAQQPEGTAKESALTAEAVRSIVETMGAMTAFLMLQTAGLPSLSCSLRRKGRTCAYRVGRMMQHVLAHTWSGKMDGRPLTFKSPLPCSSLLCNQYHASARFGRSARAPEPDHKGHRHGTGARKAAGNSHQRRHRHSLRIRPGRQRRDACGRRQLQGPCCRLGCSWPWWWGRGWGQQGDLQAQDCCSATQEDWQLAAPPQLT